MNKKIWVVHHYATQMYTDQGGRHYWLCRELKKMGYQPVIFCAATNHKTGKTINLSSQPFRIEEAEGVPFVFVNAPSYHGNGFSRFWNMAVFTHRWKRLVPEFIRQFGRPDLICGSSSEPFCAAQAVRTAHHLGVLGLGEIRDIWPDILVGMGMLSPHSPATVLMNFVTHRIYRHADGLLFTIPGAMEYLKDRGLACLVHPEKVFYLNNGVDLDAFDLNASRYCEPDEVLDDPSLFRIIYTGSITDVYDLDMLLDAAKLILERGYTNIRFLCWGGGRELSRLQQRVRDEGISNVEFRGFADRFRLPAVLKRADCTLLHCQELVSAAYGISYMKLFDYLAAAHPILCTFPMGYNVLEQYQCGITTPRHDAESLADTAIALSEMKPEALHAMGTHARQAAREYDVPVLAKRLAEIIESL